MTTIPEFEELITQRLAICHAEITGIKKAFELPPVLPKDISELPIVYVLLGAMLQPVPNTTIGAGRVNIGRRFVARLLLAPVDSAEDDGLVGANAVRLGRDFMSLFRTYYVMHPRLHTDGVNVAALS